MTKVTEPRPTLVQRLLFWGVFVAALILMVFSITSTWRSIHKLPRYQYERLNPDEIRAAVERANKTRTQAVKRAQWLAACGYEFEQAIYKQDLSDVPGNNITTVLQLLSQENNGYARLYTIAFQLLTLEREQASAEAKWNAIRSQFHALRDAEFEHGQYQLYQHWERIFESLELTPGVASLAALRQIQFPHNAFLIFLDRQLCQMADSVMPEDSAAIQVVRSKWLKDATLERAPSGYRALAVERIRATHLYPDAIVNTLQTKLDKQINSKRTTSDWVLFDGVSVSRPFDKYLLRYLGIALAWEMISVVLMFVAIVAIVLSPVQRFVGISQLLLSMSVVVIVGGIIKIWGPFEWYDNAFTLAMFNNSRQDNLRLANMGTWWQLPVVPILLQSVILILLFIVAGWTFKWRITAARMVVFGWLMAALIANCDSYECRMVWAKGNYHTVAFVEKELGRPPFGYSEGDFALP